MSDLPPAGPPPPEPAGYPSAPVPPAPWGPVFPMPPRQPPRWPALVTLLVSLAALAVAAAAWLRPLPALSQVEQASPSYTDQQVADAKAKVCAAYAKVRRAVDANAPRDGGDDPNAQLLVAVNTRQIYISGSAYLLKTLTGQSAVPLSLATEIQKLTDLLQVITLDGLASDPSDQLHEAASDTGRTIEELCK